MSIQGETILTATRLKKHFTSAGGFFRAPEAPVQAVDGVSFDIRAGEMLALVGESGSGKSTLGRLILRLIEVSSGEITFEGKPVPLRGPVEHAYRKAVQIVFQDSRASLNARRTIARILGDPMILHGLASKADAREKVSGLLERVGLSPAARFIDRYPRQFSGGQLQRIGIARALALRPRLIVADEPVSALDALIRAQILDLLLMLQREERLSFLFITHDLAVVRNIADRVAVMYLGRIVEIGSVDAIFDRPAHPYTQALLSATPVPDPKRGRAGRIVLKGEIPSPRNPPAGCRFHPRCPKVMDVCLTEDPAERITPGGVRTACHLYPPDGTAS